MEKQIKINLWESFKIAWEKTKKHYLHILILASVNTVITIINEISLQQTLNIFGIKLYGSGAWSIFPLIPSLGIFALLITLILPLFLSIANIIWLLKGLINLYQYDSIKYQDIFLRSPFPWFKVFFSLILFYLILILGFSFFIIPGIFFAIKLIFIFPLIILGKTIFQAMDMSWRYTKGNFWTLLLFSLLVSLASIPILLIPPITSTNSFLIRLSLLPSLEITVFPVTKILLYTVFFALVLGIFGFAYIDMLFKFAVKGKEEEEREEVLIGSVNTQQISF